MAYDRSHIPRTEYAKLFQTGTDLRKQIEAFVTSMVRPGTGVKNLRKVKSWTDEVWELYERVSGQERPELYRAKDANGRPEVKAERRDEIPG